MHETADPWVLRRKSRPGALGQRPDSARAHPVPTARLRQGRAAESKRPWDFNNVILFPGRGRKVRGRGGQWLENAGTITSFLDVVARFRIPRTRPLRGSMHSAGPSIRGMYPNLGYGGWCRAIRDVIPRIGVGIHFIIFFPGIPGQRRSHADVALRSSSDLGQAPSRVIPAMVHSGDLSPIRNHVRHLHAI